MAPYPAGGILCDIGCGAGAFLRIIPTSIKAVLCIDLSSGLLRTSANYNRSAPFVHLARDAGDLWGVPDGFCDLTMVMSVLQYMDDVPAREKAVSEAVRVTARGARTFFFDLRSGDKKLYDSHRLSAGLTQSNHHFVPRDFWRDYPGATVASLSDLEPRASEYYYNANFSYSVRLPKAA